jgi:integrase
MRKQGYRESTITSTIQALRSIARRADILNPESAKAYLASALLSEGRKEKLSDDLARFYRYKNISFDKPRYRGVEKLPFIPLEGEIDQLIAAAGRKLAVFLQLLKETGMRSGEAWALKWIDLDLSNRTVCVSPEKNSRPRQLSISSQLISMVNRMPQKSTHIFRSENREPALSLKTFSRCFFKQRKRIADRLQNPRILAISFKTLRHFKATAEYHRTKDILHVMQLLGHKNIRNTLVYTHLVDFGSDEYVCKVAKTVDDAKVLVESAFEYVTDIEDMKLFRKRK